MKILYAIIFLLWSSLLTAQEAQYTIYKWEEAISADPDTVFGLDLSRNKLDSLPVELMKFKNLKYLNLQKNRLKSLPDEITNLTMLEEIYLGKNKFTIYPIELCRLTELRTISIHSNEIETLPACIGYNLKVESLVLYDNPVRALPDELVLIQSLKYLDLAGIKFSPLFQETWIKKLPRVKIDFDPPCDCMK